MLEHQRENLKKEGFIPVAEAAAIARVNVSTVYRWIEAQHVGTVQRGRNRYVNLEGLLAYCIEYGLLTKEDAEKLMQPA